MAIAARLDEIPRRDRSKAPASYEATEDEMVRLEAESVAAAEEILPAAEREDLARSAEERIDPFVSRMSEKGRNATRRRAVEAALRERLGLPRLSLFTIAR
jgi:hypothetical protein